MIFLLLFAVAFSDTGISAEIKDDPMPDTSDRECDPHEMHPEADQLAQKKPQPSLDEMGKHIDDLNARIEQLIKSLQTVATEAETEDS